MFWSLPIVREPPTRETISIACDDEQGYLFYFASPHEKLHYPHLMKGRSEEKISGKMKWNGRGMYNLEWGKIPA